MVYIICIIIGIFTAFAGSLVGLGGGILLIPSLLFLNQISSEFSWATPQTIVGISLIVMVFTALSSTIFYFREGRVDYKTGFLLLSGSVPGGILGSWLNQFVAEDDFSFYFGILMIVLSLLFFIKRNMLGKQPVTKKGLRSFQFDGVTYQYTVTFWVAFITSLVVGTLSGLFGIGGGSIMVPLMILLFGFPVHIAIATSMFIIFFSSIISAGTHIILGHVSWEYVLFFIPGAWIGGTIGAKVNQRMNSRALEWILRVLLMLIGLRLIIAGLT
ncbi:sulfite exporter TauE/SafE family protein [Virgibacillus sp. DJP39]|uniref:sulfite exporter TauE/SafE family protein n=1 Tax=Virgibacillus sp. DJP39 TaxID=3409790 RepID=UPI003BB5F858